MVTRLDRIEPALNSNLPDDPRDTSTPAGFVGLMDRLLGSDYLSGESRQQLLVWMNASQTGLERLRAGAPLDWPAGDKTGTGPNGAVNDVAIFFPPKQAPILMAVFMSGSSKPVSELSAVHAELAALVLKRLHG
jgi:beta-lactamase class A